MYFTSWDANVFLCLLSLFPEEVVRGMIKMVKETHEEFVRVETLDYHCNLARHLLYLNRMYFPPTAIQELKARWKWRCPESRRNSIVRWTSSDWEWRCSRMEPPPQINPGKGTSREGYWNSGEAWSYSINREDDYEDYEENSEDELTMEYDNENTWEKYRRQYVSEWYKNIHEGRYFLFFKEHDILDSKVYDNYRLQDIKRRSFKTIRSIWDLGDRWQTAQDLLIIDGGGLGQKPGNHIEHIDDLFP
tara:strand:- start:191 stop:931 length:741 start_codon:yes stop_codon:yes gene_type:complete